MKTMRKIYNLINIPSLVIHEISHAIMLFLTFNGVAHMYFHLKERENGKLIYITAAVIQKKPARTLFEQTIVSFFVKYLTFIFNENFEK